VYDGFSEHSCSFSSKSDASTNTEATEGREEGKSEPLPDTTFMKMHLQSLIEQVTNLNKKLETMQIEAIDLRQAISSMQNARNDLDSQASCNMVDEAITMRNFAFSVQNDPELPLRRRSFSIRATSPNGDIPTEPTPSAVTDFTGIAPESVSVLRRNQAGKMRYLLIFSDIAAARTARHNITVRHKNGIRDVV
jgi:hypothetical protein